ncbi:MAG TPA: type II secretion system F family protein [Acidimicrobiia bacterium]|nr:type II secretion system F family protein [Acidimicrobiia bacterium]
MKESFSRAVGRRPVLASLGAVILIQRPLAFALVIGSLGGRHLWRKRSSSRARLRSAPAQQALLARIVLVGLTAGLPLVSALDLARGFVRGEVAQETDAVIRRSRRHGMALALAGSGPLTRPLLSRLAMATASGAPVAEAVADHLSEMRQLRRTAALERVRRLPVTLMVPLGLLILPGFVVLFVGPILFRSFGSLVAALP